MGKKSIEIAGAGVDGTIAMLKKHMAESFQLSLLLVYFAKHRGIRSIGVEVL